MSVDLAGFRAFAARHHPFDLLPLGAIDDMAEASEIIDVTAGATIYQAGGRLEHFFIIADGVVDIVSAEGAAVQQSMPGDGIGSRGLVRDGIAQNSAVAVEDVRLYRVPAAMFLGFLDAYPAFDAFYDRLRAVPRRRATASADPVGDTLTAATLADVMTANPVTVTPDTSIRDAARVMREKNISCVIIAEAGRLTGILTTGDLTNRVVAGGADPAAPVATVMTRDPFTLEPEALVFDAMLAMSARHIGHLPITRAGAPVGILTRTNLIRRQTVSAVYMVADIAKMSDPKDMASVVANVPQLLAQLVGSGVEAWKVGHIVTSVADAVTRRLLTLAEARLGPPPVPYLWLACGSQGRREQTGVSDQDNCLILDDAFDPATHDAYFKALAAFVSDGLDTCGYFYCPGDMMATADRWRQPARVWRRYFAGWIARPDPMAQMLSSVMFDLRPIAGEMALFAGLQRETLEAARKNSIFRAHMISNSLKHTPPLGLFRGFALIRSGEHKDTVDLKHSGIVPIVDLARVYALDAAIEVVNTRERLLAAREAGSLSRSGADDLVAAYDLIADIRLEHQARQVRAGQKPDNYLVPNSLSPLERNYLKDAFGVVKTMQSSLGGRSAG